MAGKFKNDITAASAENGDDLSKKLNNCVYNDNTSPEKKMQIRLMCSWGFSEELIKYLSSRTRNLSIRDLDFIRICCIFLTEDACKVFCHDHFNANEFVYETIVDELADEHIRQRMPDFNFDELNSLKEKNAGLKAVLELHKQYLELLKDQADLIRTEKNKANNNTEETAIWKEKAERITSELQKANAELQTGRNLIEALEGKLAAAEQAEREWKEKAEDARIEFGKAADELQKLKTRIKELEERTKQAESRDNTHIAQIDKCVQKALACMEGIEKSDEQHFTKIMGKLGEVLEAQKQSRRKSGPFISLFGKNSGEENEEDQQDREDPDSEKQAFIAEVMAEKRFNERHYAVLGFLLDRLPIDELRVIANPEFDDKRLKFISEWYCRSHGIAFDFNGIIGSSNNEENKEEGHEELREHDKDEVITSEEDEDD